MKSTLKKYEDFEKRYKAARKILEEDTTSKEKFDSLYKILRGVNKKLDNLLDSTRGIWNKFENLKEGDYLDLSEEAIEKLPKNTEKRKKRKRALLLLLRNYKKLTNEVDRVKAEYENELSSKDRSSLDKGNSIKRLFKKAKGPLGLITIGAAGITAGIIYLQNNAVEIIIKNQGCAIIEVEDVSLPIEIPGLEMPSDPIPDGGYSIAKVPSFKVSVQSTKDGVIKLTSLKFNINFTLDSNWADIYFNGTSLLGRNLVIDLSEKPTHELLIQCAE